MGSDKCESTRPTRSDPADEGTLASDTVFDILADPRRRYVLRCLRKYDPPLALPDVADELAVWEADAKITEIPEEDVKRIYMSLYHTHVPKLAAANVIEYSQERDMIALGENAGQLESHLDSVRK